MIIRNLSYACYCKGFTLWHYRTTDTMRVVRSPDYFDDAYTMLKEGDMVLVSAADGGMQVYVADITTGGVVHIDVMAATREVEPA